MFLIKTAIIDAIDNDEGVGKQSRERGLVEFANLVDATIDEMRVIKQKMEDGIGRTTEPGDSVRSGLEEGSGGHGGESGNPRTVS